MRKLVIVAAAAALLVALALVLAKKRRPAEPLGMADKALRSVAVGHDHRLALVDPAPRFALQVPAGAAVRVAFTLQMSNVKRLRDLVLDFVATFEGDDGVHELMRRRIDHTNPPAWYEETLDLSKEAGRRGVLQLRAEVVQGELPVANLVAWTPPALRLPRLDQRPNIILLSIDTLRADHLGCYGYGRDTSPSMDRLAAEGTLFRTAIAPSTWTLPSHASMLTGVYPSRHGAVRFSYEEHLLTHVTTLAERLRADGYATAAYTGGGFVSASFGFARGFEIFRFGALHAANADRSLAKYIDAALDRMRWTSGRPAFVFLHTYAVHSPYAPDPPYDRSFGLDRLPDDIDPAVQQDFQWVERVEKDPAALEFMKDLYDAEILQTDATVGRLLEALSTSGLAENTCLIVTSDHGEEFGDHGGLFHSHAVVYDELLRVPLIVRCPGFPAGRVVDEPVSLIDVTPTVLELAKVGAGEKLDGRSLVATLRGGAPPEPRTLLSETDGSIEKRAGAVISQRTHRYKLVTSTWSAAPSLFDLEVDPKERDDVNREHPDVVARLRAEMPPGARALLRPERAVEESETRPTPDPATLEQLRALGYLPDGK